MLRPKGLCALWQQLHEALGLHAFKAVPQLIVGELHGQLLRDRRVQFRQCHFLEGEYFSSRVFTFGITLGIGDC